MPVDIVKAQRLLVMQTLIAKHFASIAQNVFAFRIHGKCMWQRCEYSSIVKDRRRSHVQDTVALLDDSSMTPNDSKTPKLAASLMKKQKPILDNASQGYMVSGYLMSCCV